MVTVTPPAQSVTVESAQVASALPLRAMAKLQSGKPALQPLPSSLPVAAVVSSGSRTLTADSAGALFLSLDAGQHWTRVATQWKGKVTQLRLAPAAATQLSGQEQLMDSDEARASAVADYRSRRYLTAGRRSRAREVAHAGCVLPVGHG